MTRQLTWSLVFLLLVLGCGDEEGLEDWLSGAKAEQQDSPALSFVTFNTALSRQMYEAEQIDQSRDRLVKALEKVDADVVCMQEVWHRQDADKIKAELANKYPHALMYVPADELIDPVCSFWEIGDLLGCYLDRCGDNPLDCANLCGPLLANNPRCAFCIARYSTNRLGVRSCVFGKTSKYWAEGHNGLLLLSKHPISHTSYHSFPAESAERGMLSARIAGHRVLCTHLAVDRKAAITYPQDRTDITSWPEENLRQVELVNAAAQSTPNECTVLMGDLNAGPLLASDANSAELPDNFNALLAAGWTEQWRSCTVCRGNELAEVDTSDKQIDHIMFWPTCFEKPRSVVYDRILDEPPVLSDHYGLRARITIH